MPTPASAIRRAPIAVALGAVALAACARDREVAPTPPPGPARHAVVVDRPVALDAIETDTRDGRGRPLRVACATCHALRTPGALPARTADLQQFHVGLAFAHGTLACGACHVAGRADQVHLADGTPIPMTEALRLCSQCHGSQARDFAHGAHGGMSGHWDLSAGPRVRNHCVTCHDPHAPKYRGASPAPRTRDRGIVAELPASPKGHVP